jgi:peptidoglycan/LPS O-acetylase OafA/YrhL
MGQDKLVFEKSSARLPQLDGLRGIAIFLVVIWHYAVNNLSFGPGTVGAYAMASLRLTWSGVDLFFVLSGFLIGGILMDNRQSNNYFRIFYVRRVLRIFPLYFLWFFLFCLLLLAARLLLLPEKLGWLALPPMPLWSYATFSQNILMSLRGTFGAGWMGLTWSLAVEEQFYLALPLIIRYLEPRKLPWFLIACILAAPAFRVALSSSPSGAFAAYMLTPCKADALLLGTLCAWMVRQQQITCFLSKQTRVLYVAFAILLLGAAILDHKYDPLFSLGWQSLGYTWLALLYSCLLLITVTEKNGIITRIVSHPLLRRLGIIAYAVYLFHLGMFGFVHWLMLGQYPKIQNIQDVVVTAIAFVLTLALAQLSWRFFERPLVAKGHTLKYQKTVAISQLRDDEIIMLEN